MVNKVEYISGFTDCGLKVIGDDSNDNVRVSRKLRLRVLASSYFKRCPKQSESFQLKLSSSQIFIA